MGGNWCKHRHTNTQTETLALTPRANIARKCTVPFDVMACSVVEWHENRTNNNNSNDARNIKPCPFTAKSQAFSHRISFFSVSVNVFVLQFLVSFFVLSGLWFRFQWTFLYSLNTHKQNPQCWKLQCWSSFAYTPSNQDKLQ